MGIVRVEHYLLVHLSSGTVATGNCERPQVRADTRSRLRWTRCGALTGQLTSRSARDVHPNLTSSPCVFDSGPVRFVKSSWGAAPSDMLLAMLFKPAPGVSQRDLVEPLPYIDIFHYR